MATFRCLFFLLVYVLLSSVRLTSVSAIDWQRIEVFPKTVLPSQPMVFEGAFLTLHCGSSSPTQWFYTPSYYLYYTHPNLFPKLSITAQHFQGNTYLKLPNLNHNDSGIYHCIGTYDNDNFRTFTHVQIIERVPYRRVIPEWVEVTSGANVTLRCGSITKVEWFSVYMDKQDKLFGYDTFTITLLNLQKGHSGIYVCRGVSPAKISPGVYSRDRRKYGVFHWHARIIVDGYTTIGERNLLSTDAYQNPLHMYWLNRTRNV